MIPVFKNKISARAKKHELQCYSMLLLHIIGFFALTIYPICWAARLAWFYYDGTPSHTRFVGWDNFITLFTRDTVYWQSWLNTLQFTICKVAIELPLAMLLALLLNTKIKGRGFFRAMYYLPNVIGVAIIGMIFSNMFDYFGIINSWLVNLGITDTGIDWFANKWSAMTVLVVGSVWNTVGLNVLYFLSALQNVPEELKEAAYLDGASKWQTFRNVTVPMMGPVLQIILLLSINGTLHTSEYILVTTGGGPRGETESVMLHIVQSFVPGYADAAVNVGYGCAVSVVTSIIFCFIAIGYTKFTNRLKNAY